MYARLGQLFWGLLLVIFDFRLSDLDLLPDFLGYIIVAVGAAGLIEASARFRTARNLSWALAFLSVAGLFFVRDVSVVLGLINTALDCAMVWYLLGGVMDISTAKGRPDLAGQASNRRVAYLALTCVVTLVGLAAGGGRVAGGLPVVLVAVTMLVLVVMILRLIYRVRHEVAIYAA